MDLFLSRQEIRRQVLATTGYTTDGVLGSQDTQRINALIDQASLTVAAQCRWISTQRRVSVGISPNSQVVSYRFMEQAYWMQNQYPSLYNPKTYGTPADTWVPADLASAPIGNVGSAGVLEVSYWSDGKSEYIRLPKTTEPSHVSMDRYLKAPTEVEKESIYAGDDPATTTAKVNAATAQIELARDLPRSFQCEAEGIRIWPVLDERVVLRIHYNVAPTWQYAFGSLSAEEIDQQLSLVDAMAIVFQVCAELYAQQGDDFQTSRYEARAGQRIRDLRGWQSSGEAVPIDSEATFDIEHANQDRALPRWNKGPIVP